MCLAIPGKVVELKNEDDEVARCGTVDFQGNRVEVSLALVPDAKLGSWVLVHAGYALERLDEKDALETWEWLKEAKIVDEIPEELSPS
ncbi:MAG: HypC/HybG/HupF family hydrogenase formation chaperone [Deltaproteobacteria bacterium]|nr:HypC/HybG/HupF family hydrogenase formation chaperone [Deltaproteobacteria bacterium]